MKILRMAALAGLAAALTASGGAEEAFSRRLTPEEFARAGLDKLSSTELAQLDAAAKRVFAGEAEPPPAPAEPAAPGQKRPAKATVRVAPGTTVEYTTIESRIAGDFQGWDGRTIFTLDNGQRWQVVNGGRYYIAPLRNPKATITPARLGGFMLEVEGADQRVRVRQVGGQ